MRMTQQQLEAHLEAAAHATRARLLRRRLARGCWPGGLEDRSDAAALAWIRHWRPQRSVAPVPECSCQAGHCAVCN
jgi:hypothetical protein